MAGTNLRSRCCQIVRPPWGLAQLLLPDRSLILRSIEYCTLRETKFRLQDVCVYDSTPSKYHRRHGRGLFFRQIGLLRATARLLLVIIALSRLASRWTREYQVSIS